MTKSWVQIKISDGIPSRFIQAAIGHLKPNDYIAATEPEINDPVLSLALTGNEDAQKLWDKQQLDIAVEMQRSAVEKAKQFDRSIKESRSRGWLG